MTGWQLYGGGVLSGHCGTSLDHGVLAVGYTPKPVVILQKTFLD